jgi:hypothetical protein
MLKNKHKLGQYFTTNYKYILTGLTIPENTKIIIEPFCGNCDLLKFVDEKKYTIELFDIEPTNNPNIIKRDTLLNPPSYSNKFILTNPPYLARNKTNEKEIFNKYNTNDLYKCFIKEIIVNKCDGGILILPINFLSSIRKKDIELRKEFLEIYDIIQINIFENQVFDDTSSTICSFNFQLKRNINIIKLIFYPSKYELLINLTNDNNYTIGGEIYNLPNSNKYTICRLTKKNIKSKNTNILAKCIDDNFENQIKLSLVEDDKIYIDKTPNLSARTYASLIIEPSITIDKQKELVKKFNEYLIEKRLIYKSMFLANYRENKDIQRKRISFDLVYKLASFILDKMDEC